ncbi:MAG: hypothetical protein R2794_03240 [Chitinophagales bacterium]
MQKAMFPALLLAGAILFTAGCKPDQPDTDTYAAVDNSLAESAWQDIFAAVWQQAAANGFGGFTMGTGEERLMDDCPTVTFSETIGVYPNTMTIDFSGSCIGFLGAERAGKLIATFTGPYKDAGTVITITPVAYKLNGNKVQGTKTVTNTGMNADGHLVYDVQVTDGVITLVTGETITWNSSRTREWLEGQDTDDILDDVYAISDGAAIDYAAEGVNRNGEHFVAHIVDPLIKRMDCRWITQGIMEVTPDGYLTRSVDFGTGECDNHALVTIGDFAISVILPI